MKYVFKSVEELSADEVRQYVSLYNTTFDRELSEDEFHYKFTRQMGPTSYFVLIVHEEAGIVGSLGAIEVPYRFRGENYKLGLTVDAMIAPEYRTDMLAMKRQHDVFFRELGQRGFSCLFTKPNPQSYLYLKKILGFSDIGKLYAYGFFLRPFHFAHSSLGRLDVVWKVLVRLSCLIYAPGKSFQPIPLDKVQTDKWGETYNFVHRKRDAEFLRNRYGGQRYFSVGSGRASVVYSIGRYRSRLACFALEAGGMKFAHWLGFARYIAVTHPEVDLILRITGRRGLRSPLLRIPRWFLPNKFQMVVKPIGERPLPANAEFSLELSDFEVV